MTRTELIIQLLKVAIALAFEAYFVWWSLQVLDRLTPEYDAASAMVGPFPVRRCRRRVFSYTLRNTKSGVPSV
jgi:hypothetical protein